MGERTKRFGKNALEVAGIGVGVLAAEFDVFKALVAATYNDLTPGGIWNNTGQQVTYNLGTGELVRKAIETPPAFLEAAVQTIGFLFIAGVALRVGKWGIEKVGDIREKRRARRTAPQ